MSDESDRSIVVLRGDGLFDPASIVVKDRYVTVLNRIADALNQVGGPGARHRLHRQHADPDGALPVQLAPVAGARRGGART